MPILPGILIQTHPSTIMGVPDCRNCWKEPRSSRGPMCCPVVFLSTNWGKALTASEKSNVLVVGIAVESL